VIFTNSAVAATSGHEYLLGVLEYLLSLGISTTLAGIIANAVECDRFRVRIRARCAIERIRLATLDAGQARCLVALNKEI
jgi:hypothetical protein